MVTRGGYAKALDFGLARRQGGLFIKPEGDGANLWRLPLDGKPAERVRNFRSTPIFDFTLVDGDKTLVLSRGEIVSDAVLITDFE